MHFMLWTSTFCRERRITLTASATLVKRYRPSGIIPTMAATMETILSQKPAPAWTYCCQNRRPPIGMMATPIIATSLSNTRSISDCSFLSMAVAWALRRAA